MKNILMYLFFLPQICDAQLFDNTWLLGYNNDADTTTPNGIQILSFPNGKLQIRQNPELYRFNFSETNTSLSDSSGQLLSYTNGVHIGNKNWQIMEGGDYITTAQEAGGQIWSQWVLLLPLPGNQNKQIFFYEAEAHTPQLSIYAYKLKYGLLDISLNSGAGKVTQGDGLLIEDTLAVGKISAVKHANGRDWWVFVNEKNTNRFYRFLVDPQGVHPLAPQAIGDPVMDGVGQSVFSPDGESFAIFNAVSTQIGSFIDLYNFDRCTGMLNNPRQYHFIVGDYGGCAFSPNSRYLYINYVTKAYQYDLQAPNVWASRIQIAEYDWFQDPFYTNFYLMQLAPDGKIYSSSTNGVLSMHVIHNPDEAGISCNFQQHGIKLATANSYSVPTFPNYRLGPLDGTSCDTLGFDNLPVAWWRSEADTLEPLTVYFHDLSYYEPTSWSWDFGDGSPGSSERHPEHDFPGPGDYNVCLTVSNANASNTLCRTLHFTTSAADNPEITERISVWPNPFRERLLVALGVPLRSPVFRLYDQVGRLLRVQPLAYGVEEISTGDLAPGVYFWELRAGGERVMGGKALRL